MIARYLLHIEAHWGYLPRVTVRRAPRSGDRVVNGDDPGTLVRCEHCGDGFLHRPDPGLALHETPITRPELHRAVTDASGCQAGRDLWPTLWCARKRGMRPMDVFYRRVLGGPPDSGVPGTLAALFDAAGRARPSTLEAP